MKRTGGIRDDGWRIPDALWVEMAPLLPARKPHPLGCHNPRVDDRKAMDAIFFVLRTGCQWGALDATGICKHSSAHRRFMEWTKAGVFEEFWRRGLLAYDEFIGIDWSWLAMDGAMTKAPLGGEKNRAQSHRPRQEGRQAQPPHGRVRRPLGHRRERGQPQRSQDGARNAREYRGGATPADQAPPAGHVHR
jgi:transposase